MKTALFVTHCPTDSEQLVKKQTLCQLHFTGGNVDHAFFYYDAVNIALAEHPWHGWWSEMANQYNIPLIACHTAANKRDIDDALVSMPFELQGLSGFYTRLHECDLVVRI